MHVMGTDSVSNPDCPQGNVSESIKASNLSRVGRSKFRFPVNFATNPLFRRAFSLCARQSFRVFVRPVVVSARDSFRIFAHPVFFARWTSLPAFLVPVSIVFCPRSKPEASGIAARWRIASVQYRHSCGDVPKMDLPTQPMSQIALNSKAQHPIPLGEVSSLPFPALLWSSFIDLCPKAGFVFLRQLWQFFRRLNHGRTWLGLERLGRLIRSLRSPFLSFLAKEGNL